MDWIEVVGFCGTGLTLGAWSMRSSLWLRSMGLASSVAFLSYGALAGSLPVVATELVLLPLNAWRLWQLLLVRRLVRVQGPSLDWLLPHATHETLDAGAVIVREGDVEGRLTVLLSGRVVDSGVGGLLGSALPHGRTEERRTLVALTEVSVARVDLAALEDAALESPMLAARLARLAVEAMRGALEGSGKADVALPHRSAELDGVAA